MTLLIDLFGYLSVLLQGLDMVAQAVLLGSVLFFLCEADLFQGVSAFARRAETILVIAAIASTLTAIAIIGLNSAVLMGSLQLSFRDILDANFIMAGSVKAAAALTLAVAAALGFARTLTGRAGLALLGLVVLGAAIADSHAWARLGSREIAMVATAAHQAGAALWLGGLPLFLASLGQLPDGPAKLEIARRYSRMSMTGVGLIVVSAATIYAVYIGSPSAIYGTAYGAMAVAKASLLGILLLLGARNFQVIRAATSAQPDLAPVRRFVTVEIGVGLAVLFAAASITSQPPAVDQTNDRASWHEIVERNWPRVPRLEAPDHATLALPALQAKLDAEWKNNQSSSRPQAFIPGSGLLPPRNADDIAWSEFNHNWAGILVIIVGLLALLEHTGRARWARNWPLVLLFLAGSIFVRSDPEIWPLGSIPFFQGLRDPEVFQHKLLALLVAGFALFEWGVRTGRLKSDGARLVFPFLTAAGGMLLLTHSHAISSVKQQLLIELSHLPMGVLGVTAGWTRWLEVKAPESDGKWAGYVWPVCFVLVGLLLVNYHEV